MEHIFHDIRGVRYYPDFLDHDAQCHIRDCVRDIAQAAPLFTPRTRWGKPMRVRMTSAGRFGWYSDQRGYRYVDRHPAGSDWPAIPDPILDVWSQLISRDRAPDCCLINYYGENAGMGLHQDRDEADFDWPVLSISLGDDALFRIGSTERGGKTESVWLRSGDITVMGGPARLVYHGIDRIRFGSSSLLRDGGRINLTLRVVD